MAEKIVLEQIELARKLMSYGDPNLIRVECNLSYSRTYGIAYGLYRQLPLKLIQLRLRKINDQLNWREVELFIDDHVRVV